MPSPPTGAQHEIRAGLHRAVVTEVGATLRGYEHDGRPVVAGFDIGRHSTGGRGQLLAPWPNRIRDGRYRFDGREHQLPLDEPALRNAIHGLVRWASWTVTSASDHTVTLAHTIFPRTGYPFLLRLQATYRVDEESGLSVSLGAHNDGEERCPFAVGAHPYLTVGPGPVDDWILELGAGTRLVTDERSIPIGREAVTRTDADFRSPRRIGPSVLDTCFTDLVRDDVGLTRVRVSAANGSSGATVWADERFPFVMVFSGDTLPELERRGSLAIEPMTAAPDAFRSGDGLVELAPGQTFTGTWGITPS